VQTAVHEGVDVNTEAAGEETGDRWRWLLAAARDGLLQTTRALMAAGVDHANISGTTALF